MLLSGYLSFASASAFLNRRDFSGISICSIALASILILFSTSMEILVEKAGEGVQFQEQELPIDISFSKLADWLVDRKKVPADWRKRLGPIQSRVAKELQTLPREADPWLVPLSAENTAYLESRRVRDILASTNPEARTLFGGLAGAAGSWNAIVRAYERESIFLGEASQILVQYTNYEIPFLRKQVAKLQQQLADLERREAEHKRGAAASALKYQQACQELGIAGEDIKQELQGLVQQLPAVFSTVVDSLCSAHVGQALAYYQAFVEYAHTDSGAEAPATLPTLTQLRADPPDPAAMALLDAASANAVQPTQLPSANGSAPSGMPPEVPTIQWELELPPPPGGIDWGVSADMGAGGGEDGQDRQGDQQPTISWDIGTIDLSDQAAESAPQISWDVDASDLQPSDVSDLTHETAPQISWGQDASDLQPPDQPDPTAGTGAVEINWDIEITAGEEGGTATPPQISWEVDVGREGRAEGEPQVNLSTAGDGSREGLTAQADLGKAASVCPLAQTEYRNQLLDDLFELRAFLRQRMAELEREGSAALQSQLQAGAPMVVQQHGEDSLGTWDSALGPALEALTSRKTRDLLLLLSSPRFLERLAATLEQKKGQEVKLQRSVLELQGKRQELRSSLSATWPKQDGAVKRTKDVKKLVEETLSEQYNGRPVNIIGEINNVLGA